MVSWSEDFFEEFGKIGVSWEYFYCPWMDLWWFTFSGVVNSESGRLEDFGKSDMKGERNVGFIALYLLEKVLL